MLSKKNSEKLQSISVSLIAVLAGLLLGMFVALITGYNPFSILVGVYNGTFSDVEAFISWLMYSLPLIMTGLSVAYAYKGKLFNIGVEGQFYIGVYISVVLAIHLNLNPILILIAAGLTGALVAAFIGLLKALFGVNEVVVSIMMNYIIYEVVKALIPLSASPGTGQTTSTQNISESSTLIATGINDTFGIDLNYGFIVVIIALVLYWFTVEKTKKGYELRGVGHNSFASKAAGINVDKTIVQTMAISGFLAGIGGAIYVLQDTNGISQTSTFLFYGFDGIGVALLGQLSAVGILFAGLLIAAFRIGAPLMQGVPKEIADFIIGVIILSSAVSVVINSRLKKNQVSLIDEIKNIFTRGNKKGGKE